MKKDMIYLDANASTPCAPEVVQAMQPYWEELFANASSTHRAGRQAHQAITKAREQVALCIGAKPYEIVFTSGSTEGSNIIFLGLLLSKSEKRKIAISPIEHKAVLESAKFLTAYGFEIVYLPVTPDGVIDVEKAARYIDEQTALVALQSANNEIGTIQPVQEISALAHAAGAFFYVDAVQALGKIPVSMESWECDFATFSAHKIAGPKGVGALYTRGGPLSWPWAKPLCGGGQEGGLRPGTLNVPGIVGFGTACELITGQAGDSWQNLRHLRDFFECELSKQYGDAVTIIGKNVQRIPNTSAIVFRDVLSDFILSNLSNTMAGASSACSSSVFNSSHVVDFLYNNSISKSFIRFSFLNNISKRNIDSFLVDLEKVIGKLQ